MQSRYYYSTQHEARRMTLLLCFNAGHSTSKPYACDQCDFMTAYETGLAKHKYNVHEADHKLFQCELCSVQLRSKGTYIEHIGRHFNHRTKKCEICEKTFPSKCSLCSFIAYTV